MNKIHTYFLPIEQNIDTYSILTYCIRYYYTLAYNNKKLTSANILR